MKQNKPIIIADVDGVVVRWQSGLPFFMAKHNMPTAVALETITDEQFRDASELFGCDKALAKILIEEYNNSAFIRYLSAYDDALVVVNRLKEKYDFVAITALGTTPSASLNRIANLNTLFPGAFIDVMVCNHGESKTHRYLEAKAKYGERLVCFVDDLAVNLDDCHNVISNLPLMHMLRGSRDAPKCTVNKVSSWYDIEKNLIDMSKTADHDHSAIVGHHQDSMVGKVRDIDPHFGVPCPVIKKPGIAALEAYAGEAVAGSQGMTWANGMKTDIHPIKGISVSLPAGLRTKREEEEHDRMIRAIADMINQNNTDLNKDVG